MRPPRRLAVLLVLLVPVLLVPSGGVACRCGPTVRRFHRENKTKAEKRRRTQIAHPRRTAMSAMRTLADLASSSSYPPVRVMVVPVHGGTGTDFTGGADAPAGSSGGAGSPEMRRT
jgi:hypothetical protein